MVDLDPEPFVGPRPFGADDAHRFHGRTRESWELTYPGLLARRLVVLGGRAGVGKTSLIRAGVLSTIRADMAHVLPPAQLRPRGPGETSDADFQARAVLSEWGATDEAELNDPDLSGFLRRLGTDTSRPLVAVIDQFEIAFAKGAAVAADRERLVDQLARAMDDIPHLHLLLAIRSDALDQLAHYEAKLSGGDAGLFELGPLSPGAALEAVTNPLRPTSRSFAAGVGEMLVERLRTATIVDAADERGSFVAAAVEPTVLQVVCADLWRELPAEVTTIGAEHLREFGDVPTALTSFCLRAVIDVSVRHDLPLQALWSWLEASFVTDLGTRGSVYEGRDETAGMPNAIPADLAEQGLLRAERRAEGTVWYELLDAGLVEAVRRGRKISESLATLAGPGSAADSLLLMADAALQTGLLSVAEQLARGAVQTSRQDVRALAEAKSLLGRLLYDQGRQATGARAQRYFATAEDSLESAADLFERTEDMPAVGRALAWLGRLHMQRGEYGAALRRLRGALDRVRGDVQIRVDFARALRDAGQPQAALSEYTLVLRDQPRTVEALVGRGTLNASRGDAAAALRDLDTAIRLEPSLAEEAEVASARRRAAAYLDLPR